jgi:threonine/homoserine/homoserine lactone efflux protein
MPNASVLLLFAGATLALLLMPGPAVLYIVARAASQGRRAGLVSVAGIHVGTLVHVAAAVVGLSAALVASASLFQTIKLAGAAYLLYLGARTLIRAARSSGAGVEPMVPPERRLGRIFADGVMVNILNPKMAVFFLAFVPQFVDSAVADPTAQLLVLSAEFVALGLICDSAYALLGGAVSGRLRRSPAAARRVDLTAGTAYIGLGAATALTGRRP